MNQNTNQNVIGGEAPSAKRGDNARQLIASYLTIYDSYHNQKETMAYSVVTLYLAGATALYVQSPPFWQDYSCWEMVGLGLVLLGTVVLAFLLVHRQWDLCERAGDVYLACSNLASRWLATEPGDDELAVDWKLLEKAENGLRQEDIEKLRKITTDPKIGDKINRVLHARLIIGFHWPLALLGEVAVVSHDRGGMSRPRKITYGAMGLWGFFLLLRIARTWHEPWLVPAAIRPGHHLPF